MRFRRVNIRMIEKLRQLKKKSHMTNQQIAEKSSIPESTVARIFSGKTLNPTVTTVISMARAMGGSAADLLSEEDEKIADAKSDAGESAVAGAVESPAASNNTNAGAQPGENKPIARDFQILADGAANEKFYEDMITLYKNEMRKKDAWITRLFRCFAGVVLFILLVLIFDITHPTFGFVKY